MSTSHEVRKSPPEISVQIGTKHYVILKILSALALRLAGQVQKVGMPAGCEEGYSCNIYDCNYRGKRFHARFSSEFCKLRDKHPISVQNLSLVCLHK